MLPRLAAMTTTGLDGKKPSFLSLLNGVALAEAGAGEFLSAWCATHPTHVGRRC